MLASARCTSVAGLTAMAGEVADGDIAGAAFPFLVGLVTEPWVSFRHCTTKGAGRRLSACSNVAASCGTSRASTFFSEALAHPLRLGGCVAHRGHARVAQAFARFASPLSRGARTAAPPRGGQTER